MNDRIKWFLNDRFGMFIHWGLYAIPSRGEWVRNAERMPEEEYYRYFNEFDPVDYDPKKWARIAKDAGMKYAVMTAKHHDGFCMFDSKYTDFKATNTKAGRDLLREYADAFRAEGLKVGFYYSLLDWHHPDYPHQSDTIHPMRENPAYSDESRNFDNYVSYFHHQVQELCENYGKIDIMWFDFSYGDMSGEKWKATELVRMVRRLQPHILIDNRLEQNLPGQNSLQQCIPCEYSGDFTSPEQLMPPEGVVDVNGNPVPWEICLTMNNHWGHCEHDKLFKPAPLLIHKLVESVSKGGNMLLNVGPDARGNIPAESVEILQQIGVWMQKNGGSVYGCTSAGLAKPECGRYTANGNKIYAHVTEGTIGPVPLPGIRPDSVEKVRLVSSGAELSTRRGWTTERYPDYLFVNLGPDPHDTYLLPDPVDTVIEITLKDRNH